MLCSALLLISSGLLKSSQNILFIRFNQVGFAPSDYKTAVVLSESPLKESIFYIKNSGGDTVLKSVLSRSNPLNDNFRYTYIAQFSGLKKNGVYSLVVNGDSASFRIGSRLYNPVLDSLLQFFKVQRCGYTNPLFQTVCHPYDATSVIDGKDTIRQQYDVTGGWHDAGDYIKFLNTAAYATYTMMFAYEFDTLKFGFDHNKNNVPDILEECKIGLDWLIRLQYDNKFIIQVQDLRDHEQGWRRPDSDMISYDRPGFTGMGKNSIGIYTAVMACAARIWKNKIKYDEFSQQCLNSALKYYSLRNKAPDIDKIQSGMYQDNKYTGKLALAAVELYQTTGNKEYLEDAVSYADSAGNDFWWSWGDINAYAHYKLSKIYPRFKEYISKTLEHFSKVSETKLFSESVGDSWGSNTALLGTALQIILYNSIDKNNSYRELLYLHRDFILGRNQWGISFINGAGNDFSGDFHSQIAHFNNGKLPGAVAAGPISRMSFEKYKIKLNKPDRLTSFQTDQAVYHDDSADWITNEPTITSNATALFVMGYFAE